MSSRDESDLDAAIDRAVQEMLDVEPSPALRARVIERLEQPRSSFRWTWIAVPVAAVTLLVLAIWLPLRQPVTPRPESITAQAPPVPSRQVGRPPEQTTNRPNPAPEVSRNRSGLPAGQPTREGRVDATPSDQDHGLVQPLDGPAPISIAEISTALRPEMSAVEPAPMQMKALEMTPLPDMPRERQE